MRFWLALLLAIFAALLGAMLAYTLLRRPAAKTLDTPAVVEKIREVARLETLDVRLYKKVEFAPEPPIADSVWGDLANWLKAEHPQAARQGHRVRGGAPLARST